MQIIDFINKNEGFFMVLITIVYVGATIGIFIANKKSAKAAEKQIQQAKEQLDESEQQFLETQRLACMPFLHLEYDEKPHKGEFYINLFHDVHNTDSDSFETDKGYDFYFWLKNIGKGPATNLVYSWEYNKGKGESDMLPINGLMDRDKYPVIFCVDASKKIEGTLELGFSDMIGNEYEQKVNLRFENGEVTKLENDIPK